MAGCGSQYGKAVSGKKHETNSGGEEVIGLNQVEAANGGELIKQGRKTYGECSLRICV